MSSVERDFACNDNVIFSLIFNDFSFIIQIFTSAGLKTGVDIVGILVAQNMEMVGGDFACKNNDFFLNFSLHVYHLEIYLGGNEDGSEYCWYACCPEYGNF